MKTNVKKPVNHKTFYEKGDYKYGFNKENLRPEKYISNKSLY